MPYEHLPPPQAPDEVDWRFWGPLATTPYHQPLRWRSRRPAAGETSLASGVRLETGFPDPGGLLQTAYSDFACFLASVGLPSGGGYPISVRLGRTPVREAFRVEVAADGAVLTAADPDGIRRGLIWIEDEMQRRGGPFLPTGAMARRPWVRTRISRCFIGPVNRPPRSREELAEDTDFYPDEYLNRLAHEGVNGLWLTINWFRDIPSTIIPEYGQDSAPRLARLRRTAKKCARYGIRLYVFCIEPAAFSGTHPELVAAAAAHPELVGHRQAFCISTRKGLAYVEEATRTLFTAVPELGGLIAISVGERHTHCCSSSWAAPGCPRCKDRDPLAVLGDTLAAMRRGLDAANPEAELISWPYGQLVAWNQTRAVDAAARVPANVCLQHNFETGGSHRQLGRQRPMWDYWQSVVGPTTMFRDCARRARAQGTRLFAKLQVSCGHEVATTQYVPVPGLIQRKYAAMHRLGVSGAMLCWIPGGYPCLMTRAASEASFEPHSGDGPAFLLDLARRDWGADAAKVVKAWRLCEQAYTNYPTSHIFQYFGPMHAGVSWPLHLVPRRRPLAPTWQTGYQPSGDYIAQCLSRHFSYREILTLCGRLAGTWRTGAAIMQRLLPRFASHPDRRRDILVTVALGLHFSSGYNILRFYALRERLADSRTPRGRLALLRQMRQIVKAELRSSHKLLPLLEAEPLLGFHSEAEGYLYWPELIRWRIGQLQGLLAEEFPEVERLARRAAPLFPAYTGETPDGPAVVAPRVRRRPHADGRVAGPAWDGIPFATCDHWLRRAFDVERWRACGYDGDRHWPAPEAAQRAATTGWKACHDGQHLYVGVVSGAGSAGGAAAPFAGSEVQVFVEPERTKPRIVFYITPDRVGGVEDDGVLNQAWNEQKRDHPWTITQLVEGRTWSFVLTIPLRWLRPDGGRLLAPLRLNVIRKSPARPEAGDLLGSWVPLTPVRGRLVWDSHNPATDFGWLKLG